MFGESGFSKSSPPVYLCTTFWYLLYIKILLATSLVLWKNKGKLQLCSLDLPYQEKFKHQWQLYTCMLTKRLPSQNSRVQNANLCHRFQFIILFNLRCLVNFHFLVKTRLIFPRINGPNNYTQSRSSIPIANKLMNSLMGKWFCLLIQ